MRGSRKISLLQHIAIYRFYSLKANKRSISLNVYKQKLLCSTIFPNEIINHVKYNNRCHINTVGYIQSIVDESCMN